ncbi:MAG: SufD family Fe-S cluster assembly protein [Gammaproteobacteria bacterium]|nr:SufD family Fe-S cluster assembly protein [Gammaproteobacteria bacterium]
MTMLNNNLPTPQNVIIINGVLHTSSDSSPDIIIQENNIIIEPKKNSKITLYIINNENSCKQNITVNFREQHAEVSLFGLYQGHDKNTLEITTKMNHLVPHCTSRQLWKGVMGDSSKASFEGKIIVAKDAQKTEAHLSNKNLLLSKTAEVSTRPFLEIDANDVKCSHGATVGYLDLDAIFYLRSRGIAENDARDLLIEAFVNEILDRVEQER